MFIPNVDPPPPNRGVASDMSKPRPMTPDSSSLRTISVRLCDDATDAGVVVTVEALLFRERAGRATSTKAEGAASCTH